MKTLASGLTRFGAVKGHTRSVEGMIGIITDDVVPQSKTLLRVKFLFFLIVFCLTIFPPISMPPSFV